MMEIVERLCRRKEELPKLLDNDTHSILEIIRARPNIIGSSLPVNAIVFATQHYKGSGASSQQIVLLTVYYNASNFTLVDKHKIHLHLSFDEFIIAHRNGAQNYSFSLFLRDNFISQRSASLCAQPRRKNVKVDYAAYLIEPDIDLNIGLPIYEFFSVLLLSDNNTSLIVKHVVQVDMDSTIGSLCKDIVFADNGYNKKNALIEANKLFNNMIRNWHKMKHLNEINEFLAIMAPKEYLYGNYRNLWEEIFYYLTWKKVDPNSQIESFGEQTYKALVSSFDWEKNELLKEFNLIILDDLLTTLCREIVIWMGEL
ncbi:unnamed protein product [Blepharisma stoltei]|uniref:Uncharacterized protein n=1 Tax=Blepharisma stoltei TaxID=1481888 RepID=A0AAU9IRB2_9CILI|nr:unnamed protein product [Blepharisma stoltei]